MKKYTVEHAAEQFSRLISEVCSGEEVYITGDGMTLAKIVPVPPAEVKRIPGGFEGKISWTHDAFDPLTDEEMKELGFE